MSVWPTITGMLAGSLAGNAIGENAKFAFQGVGISLGQAGPILLLPIPETKHRSPFAREACNARQE